MLGKLKLIIVGRFRRKITLIFFCSIITAFFEMLGVASIAPFIAVVASPEIIQENQYLNKAFIYLQFNSNNEFLIYLGFFVIALLLLNNMFSAFMNWIIINFSSKFGHHLAAQLMTKYLNQSYEFFIDRNSADLGKNILSESHRCVSGVITPTIEIISRIIVAVFVFCLLIIVDPYIATFSLILIGLVYLIIYFLTSKKLSQIGKKSTEVVLSRYKAANETMSSIKILKLIAKEKVFLNNFEEVSKLDAKYTIFANLIAMMPRYLIESIIFSAVVLSTIFMINKGLNGVEIIPIISLYTFAGYRLMPMLQMIYRSSAIVKYNLPAFDLLINDFKLPSNAIIPDSKKLNEISFRSSIELKSVYFKYSKANEPTIKEINLKISHPSKIGLVGKTGSGKSTLVDIIIGLLQPQSGELKVDDTYITSENVHLWQKKIGYVPQEIFLLDDSIAKNIAFGISQNEIDIEKLSNVSKLAGLDDFISRLPKQFNTPVGENGAKLSGGQIQRIGIARALYFDPELIVFDESTSAVDAKTESNIMKSINTLALKKTLIIIAHRFSTLNTCDSIVVLKDGRIVDKGKYNDLINDSLEFKNIANLSS